MHSVLFVDIDGTITETVSGLPFKKNYSSHESGLHPDIKLIDGVKEAIAKANFTFIIGVSNQGGVAAEKKTIEDAVFEMKTTLHLVPPLRKIYFCPDYEGKLLWRVTNEGAEIVQINKNLPSFRKPEPGMLEHVLCNYRLIERGSCWMVGDRKEDEIAASKAFVRFCDAETWRQGLLIEFSVAE